MKIRRDEKFLQIKLVIQEVKSNCQLSQPPRQLGNRLRSKKTYFSCIVFEIFIFDH